MRWTASIACVAAAVALLVLAAWIALVDADVAPGAFTIGLSALASSSGIAMLALAGALVSGRSVVHALGLRAPRSPRAGPLRLVAWVAGTVGLSHLLDQALRAAGLHGGSALEWFEESLRDAGGQGFAMAALGIGLAAGLAEELCFRGLLLRAIAARFGAVAGLSISALLFGLLHLDLAQGLGACVLGLYLGAVALAARSTWAAVLAHVANNLLALAAAAWGPSEAAGSAPVLALSAVMTAIGLGALWRARPA